DILNIERKKRKTTEFNWEREEWTKTEVVIRACEFTVPSTSHASILRWKAGFGEFPSEERRDRVNSNLFKDQNEKMRWNDLAASDGVLRLSPEELMFLVEEERVYLTGKGIRQSREDTFDYLNETNRNFFDSFVTYRFLRRSGWTPRCGLSFGCDYLIYDGLPSESHASAGVMIERAKRPIDNVEREALGRSLWHVKKHLIIVSVRTADREYGSIDRAEITTVTLAPTSLNNLE
ncbi:hypothetical protein PFISCL1PPCAC_16689, partial [Pristionchus fissidentatus]